MDLDFASFFGGLLVGGSAGIVIAALMRANGPDCDGDEHAAAPVMDVTVSGNTVASSTAFDDQFTAYKP